jgi:3-phenylpropionate/cinnamic acid dioxygenase small subunit
VTASPSEPGVRLHPNDQGYGDVLAWLYDEAALLDDHAFDDWLDVLAPDLVYRVPVRVTRAQGQGDGVSAGLSHFDETRSSLATRVLRLHEASSWAENPPSRTRRVVTNVRVWAVEGGYATRSALLLVRSRGASPTYELLSGERRDLLRKVGLGLLLARREVLLDQSSLGMSNLSVFL